MAASDCTLVKGTKFYLSTDSGSTYTELVDIVELGQPGTPTRPKIDKTPIDPATAYREYSLGLADSGEHMFKQLWNSAREVLLQAQFGVNNYWRIVYPDAVVVGNRSKDEFQGSLAAITKEAMNNADARLVLDCKITINGAVTFTPKV